MDTYLLSVLSDTVYIVLVYAHAVWAGVAVFEWSFWHFIFCVVSFIYLYVLHVRLSIGASMRSSKSVCGATAHKIFARSQSKQTKSPQDLSVVATRRAHDVFKSSRRKMRSPPILYNVRKAPTTVSKRKKTDRASLTGEAIVSTKFVVHCP